MKKLASFVCYAAGIVAIILVVSTIIRFGTINMNRVNAEATRYKMEWSSRR